MELMLNKNIYSLECIKSTIKNFEKLSSITIAEQGMYFQLLFLNYNVDGTQLVKEFENYLIAIENVVCK